MWHRGRSAQGLTESWGSVPPARAKPSFLTQWPAHLVESSERLHRGEVLFSGSEDLRVERSWPHGHVAAVLGVARKGDCISDAETSAEVGVYTVPSSRGRGFAAAAAAGWASHPALHGRVLFYGASRSNLSSQRVTQRLGLRFIGSMLAIR